jgi:L-ornithine N5-oxygenase
VGRGERDLDPTAEHRFLVVGGGQSAAEVTRHLHRSYPKALVECAFNSYGFQPADDSPYANKVFDPQAVDHFFDAEDDVRVELMARCAPPVSVPSVSPMFSPDGTSSLSACGWPATTG